MNEVASRGQLRMVFLRWALFIVPLIVLSGFVSGVVSGSGDDNRWYQALAKPEAVPPGWVFPVAWTALYVLIGFALTMVVAARGSKGRVAAIVCFAVHFALNLAWSPLFFGMRQIDTALLLIVAILATGVGVTIQFARVRPLAALLMLPYLAWLCFATYLNYEIDRLNPDGATLQASGAEGRVEF